MNILAISGGPHKQGATGRMLEYGLKIAKEKGHQVQFVSLYEKNIGYCRGCEACKDAKRCVIQDDIQEITDQLKACDLVILAAPVYWANVPAAVKNMFDRLKGVAMEDTATFPKGRLSKNQTYILFTACNTPAPFSAVCGQSTGALRAMKEFFKTSGMTYGGKCVWTGLKKEELPQRIKKKIEKLLG